MTAFDARAIVTEEQLHPLETIVNGDGTPEISYLDDLRNDSLPIVHDIRDQIANLFNLRSDVNSKRRDTALEKCQRQATLKKYPWFRLCHLRDYLRFRTHLSTASEFSSLLEFFVSRQDDDMVRLVKVDIDKLARPSPFGWRMVSTDLRISRTGLIVEHYMTFADMIGVNEAWLHKVYERWRSKSTDTLTMPELAELDRDARFSRHAYRELLFDGILADDTTLIRSRKRIQTTIVNNLLATLTPLPP
jgi:hypothetical protein